MRKKLPYMREYKQIRIKNRLVFRKILLSIILVKCDLGIFHFWRWDMLQENCWMVHLREEGVLKE